MMTPMGRCYQIDYMFGLRYVFSPKYRAKVQGNMAGNPNLQVLYFCGGIISTAVVISTLLLLSFAVQGLFN